MALIGSRTIATVRRTVNATLTERCTVQRRNGGVGHMGEPLQGYGNIATNVACRVIRAMNSKLATTEPVGSQVSLLETYRLICPVGTPFAVEDRVLMSDGRIFQVQALEDGLSDSAFAGAIIKRVRE